MLFRNASTPRMKSRWSYSRSAVSGVGAPSLNSSVPSLLCTVSGVVIEGGTSVVTLIAPSPLRAARVVQACPDDRMTAPHRGTSPTLDETAAEISASTDAARNAGETRVSYQPGDEYRLQWRVRSWRQQHQYGGFVMTTVEHPNATVQTAWRCRVSARCGTSWVSRPPRRRGSSSTRWTSSARCRPICGGIPPCRSSPSGSRPSRTWASTSTTWASPTTSSTPSLSG